jgi:hypothetical protein
LTKSVYEVDKVGPLAQSLGMAAVVETVEEQEDGLSVIRKALRRVATQPVVAGAALRANVAQLLAKAFRQEFPVAEPGNRLANAIARGIPARQKLVESEGGSLSAEAAARELGISKAAILKRYHMGRLIAWREERQKAVRFPVWQFQNGRVLDGIEPTLKVLNAGSRLDDFGRMLFFLSRSRFLGGARPLDCLREAKLRKVLHAAEGYGG